MKGQILSRIQSYQNIPINYGSNQNRQSNFHNTKIVNQARILKYPTINTKQSPDRCLKILSPQLKIPSHRLLLTANPINSSKKHLNTSSNKDIKRSLNFDLKYIDKSNEAKNYKIPKKNSQKIFPVRSFSRNMDKQLQNNQNKHNENQGQQIQQPSSINNCKNLNLNRLNEVNKLNFSRRKQIMRIYSKINVNKTGTVGAGSEKNIRNIQSNQDMGKDPQVLNIKSTNYMMKTINVTKDYKQSPYFNFSNKKLSFKNSHQKAPAKSLNKIPTLSLTEQQQDVSIQISVQQRNKQKHQQVKNEYLQFGCSQIKEKQSQNDSSFLQQVQKNFIFQLQECNRKQELRKKKWRKLPNDFLKN